MKRNPKSKFVGYLLWFLIGALGAHRFYLRRKKSAYIILAYTLLTGGIDVFVLDFFPNASFFYDDKFYWITTIPLMVILLRDAFYVHIWVDQINGEGRDASVFN